MHHRTDIVYQYDGSFDGFLCCVFRAVYQREDPMAIFSEDGAQATLLETALIDTEPDKAGRVLRSIPAKMGTDALRAVQWCFLSGLEDRETAILAFLMLLFRNNDMKIWHRVVLAFAPCMAFASVLYNIDFISLIPFGFVQDKLLLYEEIKDKLIINK